MNSPKLLLSAALFAIAVPFASATTVASYRTDWLSDTTTGIASANTMLTTYAKGGWETTAPGGNHTFVDVKAAFPQVTGERLFYGSSSIGNTATATINLTGLSVFSSISLDSFIVGAGGGIDHTQGDGVEVLVNGTSILNIVLSARDRGAGEGNSGAYINTAPASAVLKGVATSDTDGSEFISTRTDGWGHDALFDLGADPAFDNIAVSGSGNVTIQVISRLSNGAGGTEGGNDEQIVIGNFAASFAIPEPSSMALASASALALLGRRRRRA